MSEVAVYLFLINQMELTFHINTKFCSLHGEVCTKFKYGKSTKNKILPIQIFGKQSLNRI